ncbi:MAG: ComEC/Rec2 family competence protein, partial [Balneolaceae bacterium]|nr:ComEC/Rec2 family competence protein [Balneolaceae bacterium]
YLPARIRYGHFGPLVSIITVSIVVQTGLFPILSYYFGEFSLIGPLANALIVPFLGVLLPYAVSMLLVSIISPSMGYYLNLPCEYFLQVMNKFVRMISSWDFSWIEVSAPGIIVFLIWVAAAFLISSLRIPAIRWKMLIILLSLILGRQAIEVAGFFKPRVLQVTILDVGQGDAAVIKTPNNKTLLIDAGRWSPGFNSGKYTILPYLKAERIEKIDALFLSHPHADHIGGILELIEQIPIDAIYNSGFEYDSNLYRTYISKASQKNIPVVSLSAGRLIKTDPALRIFVYGPDKGAEDSDPNERSLILELVYGSTEFLFMGDAGHLQERRLIENYADLLDTDLLKVGHHGSKTSSSYEFLKRASPALSVVSLAKSNKFRHPHKEAVKRLRGSQTPIYYTSLEGGLVFRSDGKKITRIHWK